MGGDIIITGLQSWDIDIGSNCKDIAQEFSKNHRVLYVNRAYDRKTVILNKLKGNKVNKRGHLEKLSSKFWVYTPEVVFDSVNWLNSNTAHDYIVSKNGKKWAREVETVANKLGLQETTLFIDNDFLRGSFYSMFFPYKNLIYYIRDNLLTQAYFQKHGARLEKRIMEKADFVFANSTYLAEYARNYNPNSFYIGQGFDSSIFQNIDSSINLLEDIPSPKIGYTGYITSERIDISLLEKIVAENPKWSFVFVGKEDSRFETSVLHQYENAYFLGKVYPEQVPMYINAFDVCINPQIVNGMTIGNYPRKIDEYLAVGKPIVAIKTQAMVPFSDHVYLASSSNEFVELIQKALDENGELMEHKRVKFANEHTWEKSIANIYNHINLTN